MWDSVWQSFGKAFELMSEGSPLLSEVVSTTLLMAIHSSLLAFLIGAPIGLIVASYQFKGKKAVIILIRTLMGLPPVAVGILIYLLFRGIGPFGNLNIIFTVKLMVIAQVILIAPVVAGMVETSAEKISSKMRLTRKGMNFGPARTLLLTANENRYELIAAYMFAFARATAEVGAVQIVGGNILHSTMVMTTYIALNYNTGNLQYAVALGIIIILITLALNLIGGLLQIIGSRRRK